MKEGGRKTDLEKMYFGLDNLIYISGELISLSFSLF